MGENNEKEPKGKRTELGSHMLSIFIQAYPVSIPFNRSPFRSEHACMQTNDREKKQAAKKKIRNEKNSPHITSHHYIPLHPPSTLHPHH
jgi:hypothetical protein